MAQSEAQLKSRVRLYRWVDEGGAEPGQPFALCDYHRRAAKVPAGLVMRKVLDRARRLRCNRCGGEQGVLASAAGRSS